MAGKSPIIFLLIFNLLFATCFLRVQCAGKNSPTVDTGKVGNWVFLRNNTGVVAMHMTVTRHNTVLLFDQTSAGPSEYNFQRSPDGRQCSGLPRSLSDPACSAHSVEYHIGRNSIRPLTLQTDTWCSSGSFLSNGTLQQTGGYGDGIRRIRYFEPCSTSRCDWRESRSSLADNRWYATNVALPEKDSTIVVGGLRTFTYEFVPKRTSNEGSFYLPLLHQTNEEDQHGNNLYPFVHLSADGNLFIFANRDSILLNYRQNMVVKTYPQMPGRGSRNYPSSGSSVMLPLDHADGFQNVEVLVCGGSVSGAYREARRNNFVGGLQTCGRMMITGNVHDWTIEQMPEPRLLNDMLILPTGHILIINGAKQGSAGWNNAVNPSLQPYLYEPKKQRGNRFSVLRSNKIARMYHSSAVLLPDGRVLVAGSNPNNRYAFRNVSYPTELRLQAFVPYYMGHNYDHSRPNDVSVHYAKGAFGVHYEEEFQVRFSLNERPSNSVEFNVHSAPFATHGISMNQRMLKLRHTSMARERDGRFTAMVQAPPSPNVAPSGYYMLTVLNGGIPSTSCWVRFMQS
ncbi:(methyl)glyoxal oxidase [Ranunculus cassubicifolius]